MDFTQAVRTGFAKFATFGGRAGQSEFWFFQLFALLTLMVASFLDGDSTYAPISSLVGLVFLLPQLAITSRRLHDRGMSAAWLLLVLIPVLGMIALAVMCIPKGEFVPNEYGLPTYA